MRRGQAYFMRRNTVNPGFHERAFPNAAKPQSSQAKSPSARHQWIWGVSLILAESRKTIERCMWFSLACCSHVDFIQDFPFGVPATIDCTFDRLRRSRKGANPASCRYKNCGPPLPHGGFPLGCGSAAGDHYAPAACRPTRLSAVRFDGDLLDLK